MKLFKVNHVNLNVLTCKSVNKFLNSLASGERSVEMVNNKIYLFAGLQVIYN